MKNFVLIPAFLATSLAMADGYKEHPLSHIKGSNIDLKTEGHAIAGSINGFLVLGNFDHAIKGSRLSLLRDDQRFEGEFKKDATTQVLGGQFSKDLKDIKLTSSVEFTKLIPEHNQMIFKLNQKEIAVSVSSEKFENNHYIVPTFSTTINGQAVNFKLEGQASYGYAAHLALMILSAYDFGDTYVFQSYFDLSKMLEDYSTKNGEPAHMIEPTKDLISQGFKIMRLYADKNPSCRAQYEVIYKELEKLPPMDLAAADARYHDGKDLPAAPRFCYFARSLVAHPYFNLLRFNDGLTVTEREAVVDEFEEVSRHVIRSKKNIDTPPNP